jgi:F-type H+-transporting ATPase subunit alpha
LKQPLNSPMPVEEQVVVIFAGTNGLVDDVPVEEIRRYETDLVDWFRARYGGMLGEIRQTKSLPDEEALRSAVKEFTTDFLATIQAPPTGPAADPSAADAEAPGEAESDKTLQTE